MSSESYYGCKNDKINNGWWNTPFIQYLRNSRRKRVNLVFCSLILMAFSDPNSTRTQLSKKEIELSINKKIWGIDEAEYFIESQLELLVELGILSKTIDSNEIGIEGYYEWKIVREVNPGIEFFIYYLCSLIWSEVKLNFDSNHPSVDDNEFELFVPFQSDPIISKKYKNLIEDRNVIFYLEQILNKSDGTYLTLTQLKSIITNSTKFYKIKKKLKILATTSIAGIKYDISILANLYDIIIGYYL